MGKWLLIAVLFALLALASWVAYREWIRDAAGLPPWAWVFAAIGMTFALLIGGGLMALLFYSSRMGYDEPPHQLPADEEHRE